MKPQMTSDLAIDALLMAVVSKEPGAIHWIGLADPI